MPQLNSDTRYNTYNIDCNNSSIAYSKNHTLMCLILGTSVYASSVIIANPYSISAIILFIAIFVTVLGIKYQQDRMFIASMMAANPINILAVIPGNLIFAPLSMLFDIQSIFLLPGWILVSTIIALLSFACSSINWISGGLTSSVIPQLGYMFANLLGPLILIPIIYCRMQNCSDSQMKLKGLIYYLIFPTTILLLLAHVFGTPVKNRYAELSMVMNTRMYQFVNITVNFTRTHVGFVLASLICTSTVIAISRVKSSYRFCAAICLSVNLYLLLITGSVGSTISCACGLIAVFCIVLRRTSMLRSIVSICVLLSLAFLVWSFSPQSVKHYVEERYEERLVNKGVNTEDRNVLWGRALNYMIAHPEGVGWSILVGDKVKSNPHNDYLLYAISYGIVVGLVYSYIIVRLTISLYNISNRLKSNTDLQALSLSGLGVVIVVLINSIGDHMIANRWYFNVIWSIIWYSYFSTYKVFELNQYAEKTSL